VGVTAVVGARAPVFALTALRRSAATLAAASPRPRGRLHWLELGNKLEAFEIFRRGEALARAAGPALPLASLVARAGGLVPYGRVWMVEGLGYGYAEGRAIDAARTAAHAARAAHAAHAAYRPEPPGWLAAAATDLPAASLIALHCGVGLSLGRHLLAARAHGPAAELRRGLAAYVASCRELAWPGHAAPLLEALGFITRLRLARRAGEVASELARLDEEAQACFWHGLGRSLYFLPRHALAWQGAARRLFAALTLEAPAGEGRENALAGLAWAVTMVNLRRPQILEEFLAGQPSWVAAAPGFAHGIASAVFVWHDCAPHDPSLAAWRRYRPEPAGSELARRWERQVSGPAEHALARAGSHGPDRSRPAVDLGEIFRVRPATTSEPAVAAAVAAPAGRA
jgi:hypothetical protein